MFCHPRHDSLSFYSTIPGEILMRKKNNYLFVVGGVICIVIWVLGTIPFLLQEKYGFAAISAILVITGLVLLAIAFGDEYWIHGYQTQLKRTYQTCNTYFLIFSCLTIMVLSPSFLFSLFSMSTLLSTW